MMDADVAKYLIDNNYLDRNNFSNNNNNKNQLSSITHTKSAFNPVYTSTSINSRMYLK